MKDFTEEQLAIWARTDIDEDEKKRLLEISSQEHIAQQLWSVPRENQYPKIGDQLDDLFHNGAFSDDMTAKIQSVKKKYPTPE